MKKFAILSGLSTAMKYIMYRYSGTDYGVTTLDFNTFRQDLFTTITTDNSNNSLTQFIHSWENGRGAPTNADGTKYIIQDDGYGHPTVGYGIDIEHGGYKQLFIDNGYSIEIGGEVDVDFVDALEKRAIDGKVKQMSSIGNQLTGYQIDALVSRAYNCGTSGAINVLRGEDNLNFIDSYKKYWNEEADDKYKQRDKNADFNHKLYTQYMSSPVTSNGKFAKGIQRRRQSEWTLFQTGYYDVLNKWYSSEDDTTTEPEEIEVNAN